MPGVVATVNGDRITMQELGDECFLRHGEEVLEGEISQLLLQQALEAAGVTRDAGGHRRRNAPRGRAGRRRRRPRPRRSQDVGRQRHRRAGRHRGAVHPRVGVALGRAQEAHGRKTVTGRPKRTSARASKPTTASACGARRSCWARCAAPRKCGTRPGSNPSADFFGDLAEEYSIEPTSKALRGEVPPLGRHGGQPQLEDVAFQLQDGQLSGIIQVGDKFVILRCEGRTEPDRDRRGRSARRVSTATSTRRSCGSRWPRSSRRSTNTARVDNYLAKHFARTRTGADQRAGRRASRRAAGRGGAADGGAVSVQTVSAREPLGAAAAHRCSRRTVNPARVYLV